MMLGFGWCHLRSSYEEYRTATVDQVEDLDRKVRNEDRRLFNDFRKMMEGIDDPWLTWNLIDEINNDTGLLTFTISRNHRASGVWTMIEWIAKNGPSSYGLFYCHDDEDTMNRKGYDRNPPMDYDNVFRVHRILNGRIDELPDPFFGLVEGDYSPLHPYNRADSTK